MEKHKRGHAQPGFKKSATNFYYIQDALTIINKSGLNMILLSLKNTELMLQLKVTGASNSGTLNSPQTAPCSNNEQSKA